MKQLGLCLLFALAGAVLSNPPHVRAGEELQTVYVTRIAHVSPHGDGLNQVRGSHVVGFSCAPDEVGKVGFQICYVLSQ